MNKLFNKELKTAGSSGSADAAPRMTVECGHSTPICHCEEHSATWQSGEIASHAFAMTQEYGRSMVEMLGVLAVMGILSVAGIAGYKNAMNKYRANELLNEASKRAVVLATRALTGQQTVSLAEFSGHSSVAGGTFADEEAVDVSGNTFAIQIKNVDEDVCQQMKNTIGSSTVVREIPENCGAETISLVFNKDLSTSAVQVESLIDTSIDNPQDCQEAGKTWCYASTGGSSNGVCSNVTDCCKTVTLNSCQTCQSIQGQYVVDYKLEGASCNFQGTNDGQCLPYAPTGTTGCGTTNIQNMCLDNMKYAPSETEKSCLPVPCSMTGTCCQAAGEDGLYDVYGEGGLQNLMGQLQEALGNNDLSKGVGLIDQINVAQCTSCDSTDGSLTNAPDDTSCYYLEGETLLQNYSNMNNFTDVTLPGKCQNGKCSSTKPEEFCDYYTNGQYKVDSSVEGATCHKYYSCDDPNLVWIYASEEFHNQCIACGRVVAVVGGEDSVYCIPAGRTVEGIFLADDGYYAYDCQRLGTYYSTNEDGCTAGCKNTPFQRTYNNGACSLNSCPTGYFSANGRCVSCNAEEYPSESGVMVDINSQMEGWFFVVSTESDCQKCTSDHEIDSSVHIRTFGPIDGDDRDLCRY